MRPVLIATLAVLSGAASVAAAQDQANEPVRVWLNRDGVFERTDKVRAYARTGVDGYLLVLHAEPSGRIRVLFPLDPVDDAFVRAGRSYEIRGRGDREAVAVYDAEGSGIVYAALAKDPFQLEGLVVNGHWDYRAPDWTAGSDPEASLAAIAMKVTAGRWFDYDLVRYDVGYASYAAGGYPLSIYDPYYDGHYWYGGSAFSISFGIGWGPLWFGASYPWYPYWGWDPWYWGWGSGSCWYGCGWGYPYYGYPYYGYPYYGSPYYGYPYYGYPTYGYPSHYYPYNGYAYAGYPGGYAFKSYDDRWGLQPNAIGPRRRAPEARTVASTGGLWSGDAGRRTVNATSRSTAAQPASAGRRTAPSQVQGPTGDGSTNLGTVGPSRRAAPGQAQGSARSGTGTTTGPSRRAAPEQTSSAKPTPLRPAERSGQQAAQRGLRVANDARAPRSVAPADRTGLQSRFRSTVPGQQSGSGARPADGSTATRRATPSSGRTNSGQTPSLTRRSGPSAAPSAPRSSAGPRSAPSVRSSPPSGGRSGPPSGGGRSSPPSGGGRSSPPSGGGGRRH